MKYELLGAKVNPSKAYNFFFYLIKKQIYQDNVTN